MAEIRKWPVTKDVPNGALLPLVPPTTKLGREREHDVVAVDSCATVRFLPMCGWCSKLALPNSPMVQSRWTYFFATLQNDDPNNSHPSQSHHPWRT